jgi:ATP-dependent RNA helicase DDX54/DBP10
MILSPTRELAQQTYREAVALTKFTSLKTVLIVGGEALEHQFSELELGSVTSSTQSTGPDIIVGTPGRVLHLLLETPLPQLFKRTSKVSVVLDEADRLFEMGFRTEIETILQKLHVAGRRQTLLFSATLPAQVADFAKVGLHTPHVIRLDVESKLSSQLALNFFMVLPEERDAALLFLLNHFVTSLSTTTTTTTSTSTTTTLNNNNNNNNNNKETTTEKMCPTLTKKPFEESENDTNQKKSVQGLTLIFCASRHHVEYLHTLFRLVGWEVCALYGRMDQAARNIALAKFRKGLTPVMIVTDVAARGIDIPQIDTVINYDFPPTPKIFVHRVGRTARLTNTGSALTLVTPQDWPLLAHTESTVLQATRVLTDLPMSGTHSSNDSSSSPSASSPPRLPAYYGHIPSHLLGLELERVATLRTQNSELAALYRSMNNAYKIYYQTRPPCPAHAVESGKTLDHSRIHPLLLSLVDQLEIEKTKYIAQLRRLRHRETIFEMEDRLRGHYNEVMLRKRLLHEPQISKHHFQVRFSSRFRLQYSFFSE